MYGSIISTCWCQCPPHLIHASLGPPESTPQIVSWSVQPFFPQLTTDSAYTLQCTTLSCLKIVPSHKGIWDLDPSNRWFIGPTQVLNPSGILIGSAVFAGLTIMTDRQTDKHTDRQTDHATPAVRIGHICMHSTARWLENKSKIIQLTITLLLIGNMKQFSF